MSPTEEPFVKVDSVSLGYGDHVAVQDLSLAVGDGEFVAIIGPSGCGKSTLLHLLAGLQRPLGGSVHLSGRRVTGALATEIRIGYVFQDHRLLPWRTVAQNIVLAMKNAGVPRSEWNDRIDRYLSMLEVSNYRDSWPLKLSGGQRQRVSIARALAIDPALILMDEPFSGLDEVTGRTLRQGLVRLWQDTKVPIVFVTHSIREALFLADRVVVLSRGPARLLREFPVELPRPRVYEDPELAKLESAVVSEVIEEWGLEGPGRDSDGRAGGPA
ncbi:MAG: ABC transporter ATP-binding protein [Streptosporangiaceae bacterium]